MIAIVSVIRRAETDLPGILVCVVADAAAMSRAETGFDV